MSLRDSLTRTSVTGLASRLDVQPAKREEHDKALRKGTTCRKRALRQPRPRRIGIHFFCEGHNRWNTCCMGAAVVGPLSCRARASSFSYGARASGIGPNLRHRSARKKLGTDWSLTNLHSSEKLGNVPSVPSFSRCPPPDTAARKRTKRIRLHRLFSPQIERLKGCGRW